MEHEGPGPEHHGTAATAAKEEIDRDVWNIDFDVAKSIRYHAWTRSYWDRADHWNKIAILLASSAAVVSFLQNATWLEPWVTFAIAVFAIFDIVFGFSEQARIHDALYRQFCRLAQDIAGTVSATELDKAHWRARRLEIETEEPSIWKWLNRSCYRQEAQARGVKKDVIDAYLKGRF